MAKTNETKNFAVTEALIGAISKDKVNLEEVVSAIYDGADVNAMVSKTFTEDIRPNFFYPLFFLISERDDVELFLLFVYNLKDINMADSYGNTILHWMIRLNSKFEGKFSHLEEMFAFVLQHPDIDVNKQGFKLNTPIHQIVWWEQPKLLKLLLKHPKIDLNIMDNNNDCALDILTKIINTRQANKIDMNEDLNIRDLLVQHGGIFSPVHQITKHFNDIKEEEKSEEINIYQIFDDYNIDEIIVKKNYDEPNKGVKAIGKIIYKVAEGSNDL